VRPTTLCVLLSSAGIAVALLAVVVDERLAAVWVAYVAVAALATGLDALFVPPERSLRVDVSAPDAVFIGEAAALRVAIGRGGRLGLAIDVLVDLDAQLVPQPVVRAHAAAGGTTVVEVPLVPTRRGRLAVHALWLAWKGPLGLVRRQVRRGLDLSVAVVPNTRPVRAAAIRFFGSREATVGAKVERYVGGGSEFASLRPYVPGMDHRAIDWKASARHRALLCQEFRAERNHQIVLAVDTGALMREPLEGVPKLDHAVQAALLLAYVGLHGGDRVGLFAFDERVRVFTEPAGGVASFARIQTASADLRYSTGETNFTLGMADLATRLKRRSLVVVLTDFVDVVTAELMVENLGRLARRHLVVFVTLSDPTLRATAEAPPQTLRTLYRAVVAGDLVRERELVLRRLQRLGAHTIDAPPRAVSARLLNRYLDIQRREAV
jgi:uncharacterized protein (DUF58 family)